MAFVWDVPETSETAQEVVYYHRTTLDFESVTLDHTLLCTDNQRNLKTEQT